MRVKTAIAILSVAAAAVYATGVGKELIPVVAKQTIRLSQTGGSYKVSGIGESANTKAAIINHRVVSQGDWINDNVFLTDVHMDSTSLSADNIQVTIEP